MNTATSPRAGNYRRRTSLFSALAIVFAFLAPAVAVSAQKQQQARKTPAPARQVKQYTIEQFMGTTRITGASFSPDERQILFASNKTGIFNVYTVPTAGGEPQQLTRSTKESTYAVSYFPNDARILYTYDRGGNENSHLYVLTADREERDLTPGEKVKANFLGWSHDLKSFYYSTNERDPRYFDIFKMSIDDYKSTLLFKNEAGYDLGDISKDEKYLALSKSNTTTDTDMYLYNAATKELKHLTPHKGEINYSPQAFDPASRYLYYLTDEQSEFAHVARYELATGKTDVVERAPWDVMYTYFSRNGKYRVVATNEDARTVIKIYDHATGKPVALPRLPNGDITGVQISRSEQKMAFYLNGDRSPSDLHVYDFTTRKVTKLTSSLNPEIDPRDLVETEVVRYKSFDHMEIPSILYKPHGATAQQKAPALVWVHGGPGGQTRTGYSAFMQYLANHGYVVLGVNNRGSSGYGKTFYAADDGKHGREPLWDCIEAKKYLASLGYVDERQIGIIGGSYGGYMVLAALAFKPEEFAVGVDIFGVSNWVRTLQSIPPYWESFRKALYKEMGDPSTDLDNLRAISPLFHADKIRRPLIVLQGKNDPRVIKPESDEIVEAVKRTGGVVEYIVFDDEGHGFSKKANEIRAYKSILDFLDKHLKGAGAATNGVAHGQ
ncbi:MAG TPA: S9 family peptidase [Pyrinomonadaceae bacterium]|jgi:dipeptidyl aminopeptidase/acylaminoacyl peptidase